MEDDLLDAILLVVADDKVSEQKMAGASLP
jgi:hypothetical protein